MAHVKYTVPRLGASAQFLQDEASREHILAGGVMLESADFAGRGTADDDLVEAGTLVGRTRAERGAGRGFGPYSMGDPNATPAVPEDEEVFLTARDVRLSENAEGTLVRHGTLIEVSALPASVTGVSLEKVRELYQESV